jgi:hypothetical protein
MIKSPLISTTGPLRKSVELSLIDFGYKHSVNEKGDSILTTLVTSPKIAWLAEIAIFEQSGVIGVSVVMSEIFKPKLTAPQLQELISRLNLAVIFGAFVIPYDRNCVIYRTARDFPDGTSPHQVSKFLGQLNFPLCLWREVCSKFPPKTNVRDRLQASLIRLDAHESDTISRQTRRALLRLIKSTDASDEFEPQPSSFSLMLV